jgi:non-specific serine/threonine protein kinase
MPSITLRDFQVEGVRKLKENEEKYKLGSVLAYQMGLGKTLTFSWFLIERRKEESPKFPDLIIVPLCVLSQWKSEILRINDKMKIYTHHGLTRHEKIKEELAENVDFVICTYYPLITRELEKYSWNRIVLDEAHNIRNGIETQHKGIPKKATGAFNLSRKARFRHCITGTPFNNNDNDLLSLMQFIGFTKGIPLFVEQLIIQKTKENLMEPINEELIPIENPEDKDLTVYNEILHQYTKTMAQMQCERNIIRKRELYEMAMRYLTKLRVFCDLFYFKSKTEEELQESDIDHEESFMLSSKLQLLYEELVCKINEVPYKRIIVFSCFVSTLTVLEKIINELEPDIKTMQYVGSKTKKERDEIVSQFTDETATQPMILFASLGAGSVGLNLTPCSTIFMMDTSMNPFDELQAINRVHRLTQKNKVNIYKFYMKNMIEENILMTHKQKIELAKNNGLRM